MPELGMPAPVWKTVAAAPAIAPALPIIDTHHHFWADGYEAAAYFGRFLPEDLSAEIRKSGHNIVASVYLEAGMAYRSEGPDHLRCVGETDYAEAAGRAFAAQGGSLVAGIIGHAELLRGDGVAAVLEAHLEASPTRFRGIRDMLSPDPDAYGGLNIPPGKSRDPAFRAGFAQLARFGLSFDALCQHTQLEEVIELAGLFPDTPIILNHLGEPIGVGRFRNKRDEVFADWKVKISNLARYPNVSIKLSGLGMAHIGFGWARAAPPPPDIDTMAAAFRPYILHAIEAFSPSRCMFGSNFPVDGLSYGYGALWNAFKHVVAGLSPQEQRAVFHDTAARVYRLAV
jgi:L-fuconolactonase